MSLTGYQHLRRRGAGLFLPMLYRTSCMLTKWGREFQFPTHKCCVQTLHGDRIQALEMGPEAPKQVARPIVQSRLCARWSQAI